MTTETKTEREAAKERAKQEAVNQAFEAFGSSAGAYGYMFDAGYAAATVPADEEVQVCGSGVIAGRFLVGCDRPFKSATDIFRCYDCEVSFHRECLKRHCKEKFPVSAHATDLLKQEAI